MDFDNTLRGPMLTNPVEKREERDRETGDSKTNLTPKIKMLYLVKKYFSIRNRLRVVALKFQIAWYRLTKPF
jgi:hypothetical protein